MLRLIILWLSRSRVAERLATHAPGLRGISRRFVAGNTQADAVDAVRRLNAEGFEATVSFLGEAVTTVGEVDAAVREFTTYMEAVRVEGLRSHVSIKLTELGLAFDAELAARKLDEVLRAAEAAETFVRIDMEDSRYTEKTLALFREARRTHDSVGIVIQAYLRRSAEDVVALAREGAPVRLVKGAYREDEDVAVQEKAEVDAAFIELADGYFANMADGGWLAIATHDGRMVREALASARRHGVQGERYEVQMLYGIRPEMQRSLRDAGHRVRVYVPYGSHWYPYMMRRLAERPANLWFFLRGAFRG
jgi:proline dehydrogenase